MRKIIISLIVPIVFSCSNKAVKTPADNDWKTTAEAAAKSEIIERKCFAGFEFGMTEEQVDSVLRRLLEDGKIANYNGDKTFQTCVITDIDMPLSIYDFHYKLEIAESSFYLTFFPHT